MLETRGSPAAAARRARRFPPSLKARAARGFAEARLAERPWITPPAVGVKPAAAPLRGLTPPPGAHVRQACRSKRACIRRARIEKGNAMGCRSEVKASTTERGYALLLKECDALNAAKGVRRPLLGTGFAPDEEWIGDGCVAFGWHGVKWFDCFADVAAVMEAMEAVRVAGEPLCLIREGEEPDDFEYCGEPDGLAVFPIHEIGGGKERA